MSSNQHASSSKSLFLGASLILIVVMFAVPVSYSGLVHLTISILLFVLAGFAAWKAGFSSICSDDLGRRMLALAGGMLILPWILFSFLAGYGPPEFATPSENQVRYIILLINTSAVAVGLVILRQALYDIGERFFSTIGFAAIILSSPLYLVFSAVSLVENRAVANGEFSNTGGTKIIDETAVYLLFAAVCLTYLATAAYSSALSKSKWLGKRSSCIFVGISLLAVLLVGVKIAATCMHPVDSLWSFSPWYAFPGQVLSIPAVPWILPGILGVVLLRRVEMAK